MREVGLLGDLLFKTETLGLLWDLLRSKSHIFVRMKDLKRDNNRLIREKVGYLWTKYKQEDVCSNNVGFEGEEQILLYRLPPIAIGSQLKIPGTLGKPIHCEEECR